MNIKDKLAYYEQIFASIFGAVYVLDLNTMSVEWITDNDTVRNNLGLTPEMIISMGSEFPKRLKESDYTESFSDVTDHFKENPDTKWIGIYRIQSMKGNFVWVLYSTAAFEYDENNVLCKTVCMAMDVTQQINTNKILTDYIRTSLRSQYKEIYDSISEREIDVIKQIAEGKSTKEVADSLFLSPHTIESHKAKIFKKLNISNSVELAILAEKIGLTAV